MKIIKLVILKKPYIHAGAFSLSNKQPEGLWDQAIRFFMAIFISFLSLIYSLTGWFTKTLNENTTEGGQHFEDSSFSSNTVAEEIRPPSPTSAFTEISMISSIIKRLVELEEKVVVLQSKPSEMPSEKEELLNAAVCRVDALEAELIATKKVQSSSALFLLPPFFFFEN